MGLIFYKPISIIHKMFSEVLRLVKDFSSLYIDPERYRESIEH